MDSKVPSSSPHLSPIFCNYIEPKPDPRFNPNNRTDSVLLNGPKPYTIPNPKANPTRSLTLLCAAQFSPSPYIYIYIFFFTDVGRWPCCHLMQRPCLAATTTPLGLCLHRNEPLVLVTKRGR
jgi:hypothetical protein